MTKYIALAIVAISLFALHLQERGAMARCTASEEVCFHTYNR